MKKNPFGAELNPISRLLKSIAFLVLLLSLSVSSSAQQANQTQANQTLVDQVHQASTDLRAKIRQDITDRNDLWPYKKWGDTLWALTLLYENQRLPEVNERLRVHLADSSQTPFNYFDAIDYIKILELFRMESSHFPGRLEYSTEMKMKEALWKWAKEHEDYWDYFRELDNEPMGSVWSVYASENHDLVRRGGNALIFAILAQDPNYSQRTTNNGMTVGEYNQHYTVYLKKWIKERAAAGVWMEVGAAYAKYSWSYLLGWHDLHPDPEVRQLAKMLLDIAFIDSAQLSFSNGFQGGGHSRAPRGNTEQRSGTEQWLGLTKSLKDLMYGETGGHSGHSKVYETSTYQVPEIAVFLRKLGDQQGPFQIKNRVIAETARPDESHPSIGGRGATHYLKSDSRFINYNHKTPTYSIGGTLQIIDNAADGVGDDSGITRQDRWGGIFFNDENNSRVIPFAESNRNGGTRTHNAFWQVQHKNLMVAQRSKRSAYIHRLMVHVSEGLEQQEEDGWVFTSQGDAYAAVKVLGGYFRDTAPDFYGDQTFIIPHDQYAPIVFFAGSSHDGFSSFIDFKDYVLNDLQIEDQISNNKRIILNRPNEAQLIFHTDYRAPIINDAASPYNATSPLRTDYIYKSPYMNTGANKYQVVVGWENYKKLYDFQAGEIIDLSGPNAGSLVHQLELDETTGTHVENSAGYGSPGTSYGGLQWKPNDGIVDGAAELDGIDDYIDFGTSGSLAGTTDFTVSAWVKTSSKNQTQYIVQQRGTRSYHGEFMVYVNSHGKASFAVYNGGYQFQMASSSAINDGQWHHIAMIREGTVGKIYIDGQLETQVTGNSVKALDPSLNLAVGASLLYEPSHFFNGMIDEVRIYTRALSSLAIENMFTVDATSLAHRWPLDEASGTRVENTAGLTTGTAVGGLLWDFAGGHIGGAAEFDGIDDYINLGTSGSLAGTTDFTVSAWVKTSSKNQTQYIVQQRGTRSYNGEFMVYVNSHGKASFAVYNGGYQFNMASSSAINDGQWHHIAMTRDGTVGKIYVDGQLESQVTGNGVKALDPSLNLAVGASLLNEPSHFFYGMIDEVRIYKAALTAQQIDLLYRGVD